MKGGVAKTTSCQNIAARLKSLGFKTLVIDWDPQGDLSHIVLDEKDILKNTKHLVLGENINDCITKTEEFDIIATLDEEALVSTLEGIREEDRHYVLADGLENLREYDYVLIDCPPTEGSLPLNALVASNYIFLPVTPEDLAIRKMENTLNLINKLKKRGLQVEIGGIFLTRVDRRLLLHNDNINYLKDNYKDLLMKNMIPINIRLSELTRVKESIFKYSPNSSAAEAYIDLTQEIIEVVK